MSSFLEVLLGAYGVSVKSYRQLRGGTKLLELFSISSTNSPQDNFRRLKVHLRNFFPQIEESLCIAKCARGDRLELCYVAALSVGALIAQDLSKASSSLDQSLPDRLRNLCAYQGAEVDSIKEFCEIVFKDDDVPTKIRKLLSTWMNNSENDISSSSASSINSSLSSISGRTPLSPLNVVLRTPENRLRVREKYNQEVVKLRGDLLIMRERYDHLEADMKQQAEAKDRELKELQNRVRFLREVIDSESVDNRNNAPAVQSEVSAGRLKMLQKQVQQLQEYEQKFFDEKVRAEELETKLLQDEKKIKDLKAKIQILEATIFERDEEISQAADEMSALRDRLEEQRADISLVRHRNQSNETLDSVPDGENLGDAVQDLLVAELKSSSDELKSELEAAKNELSSKNVEVADLQLSNQMMREQIAALEGQVEELRAQIRSHLETITHAAAQANDLSAKLQVAQSEAERLRSELGNVTDIKQKLEERRKYLENKVQLLKGQIEDTQNKFSDMDRIKSLIEEQLKAQTVTVEDLRSQVAEKTARISSIESELSRATSTFTETLKSMNTQLGDDRKIHSEEKLKLERRITALEQDLSDVNLQRQTLYTEIEKLKIERAEIHTQLNIQLESQSKMKKEISALEGKLHAEEEARRTFEVSYKQAVEEIKNLQNSNEVLKTECEQRKISGESMKNQSEHDRKTLAENQRNLKMLEEQHRTLKKNYIASCKKLQELTEQHEALLKENDDFKRRVEELEAKIDEQKGELTALEAKISELTDALASESADKLFMQEALDQASATISENDTVISDQRESLSSMQEEKESLKAELIVKGEELQKFQELQEGFQKRLDSTHEEMSRCEEQFKQREKEAENRITQITEQLTIAEANLRFSQDQLETLKTSLSEVEREKSIMVQENDEQRAEIERLEKVLATCGNDFDSKVLELETRLSKLQSKCDEAEVSHEQEKRSWQDEMNALKGREDHLKLEVEQCRARSITDEALRAELQTKLSSLEKELEICKEDAERSGKKFESQRTAFRNAIREKDVEIENHVVKIRELTEKLDTERANNERIDSDFNDLKSEHKKLQAEIAEVKLCESTVTQTEVEHWKNFRKNLVYRLEHFDVEAPVMDDEQLLCVIDKALEYQKKAKELQVENQNLIRTARNAEDNVKCRMMELTSDNDQLKRKLRESSAELSRCQDELKEITATVIRAKNGDTFDGTILNSLCRDIMNLAVTCQENATTKKEVTELRLMLNETRQEKERLQAQLEQMEKVKDELDAVRTERDHLEKQSRIHQENIQLGINNERQHEATMELVKEGYDFEVERLRGELQNANRELAKTRLELKNTQEYVSTLLDKYDKTKEYNLKKISGLHDIIYQNNIPIQRARRKSPNQNGLPISSRHSDGFGDDVERKLREKDEEIRRLRLAKSELEKRVCAATVNERRAAGFADLNSSRNYTSMVDLERQRMPPPLQVPGNSQRDRYSCLEDRAWKEFREPSRFSASICSENDSFSVKSMPVAHHQDLNSSHRSYSTRSLLYDNDPSRYGQRAHPMYLSTRSLTCAHRGAPCVAGCKFVPQEEDFPSPPAMCDKPLPAHGDPKLSTTFDSISDLNYKCDLDASYASSRGGRSVGLGGLGLGDDEEAQFMNPKNLEDLKNGRPMSPTDPDRSSVLQQRNSRVPPHLRSSYPVETQNGKIPVTPLLQKKRPQ